MKYGESIGIVTGKVKKNLSGQLDAPHTQNFEIQVPYGSHQREIF
jgi:hypothetical protein